jgi:hypothetical protein
MDTRHTVSGPTRSDYLQLPDKAMTLFKNRASGLADAIFSFQSAAGECSLGV